MPFFPLKCIPLEYKSDPYFHFYLLFDDHNSSFKAALHIGLIIKSIASWGKVPTVMIMRFLENQSQSSRMSRK